MQYVKVENNMVVNAIECDDESFATSIGYVAAPHPAGIGWTYDGSTFSPPVITRTLQELKDRKRLQIKRARSTDEYGGFAWDGSTFDSDQVSQGRITGAVLLAQLNPTITRNWTLADNSVRTLSASDILSVGTALGAHVDAIFAHGQALQAQIDAATNAGELAFITW